MGKTIRKSKTGKKYKDKDRRNQKNSKSCLHSGGCPYCLSDRLHNTRVKDFHTKQEIVDAVSNDPNLGSFCLT